MVCLCCVSIAWNSVSQAVVSERQPSASSGNLLETKVSRSFSDLLNQVLWAPGERGGCGGWGGGRESVIYNSSN